MQKLALVFCLMFFAAQFDFAQPVSVGALGGVPLVEQTNSFEHDESRPYVIGPSVEVRLPAGFALEADALYQRVGGTFSFRLLTSNPEPVGPGTLASSNRLRANLWEFPLLGKYYFRRRSSGWQPFLGTGWALRFAEIHQAGSETSVDAQGALNTFSFNGSFRSDLEIGANFAAGVRFRVGHFALSPQVRCTRWGGQNNILRKNEAAAILGISF